MHPNQRAKFAQCNPYTMDINKKNQNYYNCGGFGHLVRNCRNRETRGRIEKDRRLKYRNNRQENRQDNLNRDRDLIVLNYISVVITDLQCSLE